MKQAFVYLTLNCNNNCSMCYMHEHYSRTFEMVFENACELLRKLREDGVEKVTFLGGEPTLYSHLLPLLRYSKDISTPFVRIQTNGQFMPSFLDESIVQECVDAFTFSLDGHTAELNGSLRKGSDFNLTVQNIKKSLTGRWKIAVNATVSAKNIDNIFDIIEFINDLGVPHLYLNLMFETNWENISVRDAIEMPSKWASAFDRINHKYANTSMRIKLPIGFSKRADCTNNCQALDDERIYIMPNMDTYPCILLIDDPNFATNLMTPTQRKECRQLFAEHCDAACMFLKNTYAKAQFKPLCLYNKIDIGAV